MGGKPLIGSSIYGVVVIDGSLYSRFYSMNECTTTVDREIFVLKIFRALKFHGAKFS